MKNKILQLNKIYSSSLTLADKVLKILYTHHIDSALGFYDQICSRIDGELICRNYPTPIVICHLHSYKTQIGLDLATNENYLGFVKFTLSKDEILKFKFDKLDGLNYTIYSTYNHQFFDSNDIKKSKRDIKNYNDHEFRIKIDFSSLSQVEKIIERMTKKNNSFFASASYTCICGSHITIDAQNGKCPVCGKESSCKRKYKYYKCPVCKNKCFKDQYDNGKCKKCGWIFDVMGRKAKNKVIYPNLISLNKAKKLFKEGNPLRPNLDDFLDMLYFYSEVDFCYKSKSCCVFLFYDEKDKNKTKIEFGWSPESVCYFKNKEDFIQNAKIDGKFVRDIWDEVENPKYM